VEPIELKDEQFLLPDGYRRVSYIAPKGTTDILPLPTIVTPDGRVVSQWRPTPGELALLNNGVAVTLVLHSGFQVPPIQLGVGGFDLR